MILGRIILVLSIDSTLKMNNGKNIPVLGLGTWNLHGKTMENAVLWALNAGYKHFDTAAMYKNESDLGKTLQDLKRTRSEYFITTKVWPSDFGFQKTKKAFDSSLRNLNMEYVDLYLIHWPSNKESTHETWKALIDLYHEHKCYSIGVSNFSINDLEGLKDLSDIIPMVNQIEFHPFNYDPELLNYCQKEGIVVVSYSPLTKGSHLNNKQIKLSAQKYNKSPAQLLLRWGLQHGTDIIPKSSNRERIKENATIFDFEITTNDMEVLDALNS